MIVPYLIILAYSAYAVLPFLWILSTSLKTFADTAKWPPVWVPRTVQWDNYVQVFRARPFGRYILNSSITSLTTTFICLFRNYQDIILNFGFQTKIAVHYLSPSVKPNFLSL